MLVGTVLPPIARRCGGSAVCDGERFARGFFPLVRMTTCSWSAPRNRSRPPRLLLLDPHLKGFDDQLVAIEGGFRQPLDALAVERCCLEVQDEEERYLLGDDLLHLLVDRHSRLLVKLLYAVGKQFVDASVAELTEIVLPTGAQFVAGVRVDIAVDPIEERGVHLP